MKNPFSRLVLKKNLIDLAFSLASRTVKKADIREEVVEKARQKEGIRIKTVGSYVHSSIMESVKSFPDTSKLTKIYMDIMNIFITEEGLADAKKEMKWSANKIKQMQMFYLDKLKKARHTQDFRMVRMQFYGRVKSIVNRFESNSSKLFPLLILKKLPDFEDVPTTVLAGLPNVGKSSLMNILTGTKAKVRPYPFTTKGILLGFINRKKGEIEDSSKKVIQIIDTPGFLDREVHNEMEMQGVAVLKQLADIVIFVFDSSEIAGSLEKQMSLFKKIKRMFDREIIVVENKTDIAARSISEFGLDAISVSCKTKKGFELLKKEIMQKCTDKFK